MMKIKSLISGLLLGAFFIACASAQTGQLGPGQVWGNAGAIQALAKPTSMAAMEQTARSVFNVATYGAVPDYHESATLSTVAGTTVSATGNPFTSASVGSLINITGAGAAGADYFGTITGFTNGNSVTVSPAASTITTNVFGQFCIDNTTAIQAAITALRAANGGTILIPTTGKYCVQQLNFTNAPPTILTGVSGVTGSFLIPMRSTNSVIDATGTEAFNMRDISVGVSTNSNPSKQLAVPKVGLLIAPSVQIVGRDFMNLENVYWTGRYSIATAYLDRTSSSSCRKVGFTNYQQTPLNGTFAGVMTHNNALGITSDFVTTYTGAMNFSDWSLTGCEFHSIDFAAGTSNQALYLDNVREIQFFGGNMSSSGSSIINLASGDIQDVLFQGVTFYSELGPSAVHLFGGVGGMTRVQLYSGLLGISGTAVANSGTNTNYVQLYDVLGVAGGGTGQVSFTSGGILFASSATSVGSSTTPALGTPSAVVLTNGTGLPISTGVSGLGGGVAGALGSAVSATGGLVGFNGALGTPSSGTLTNATGLPISSGVSGLGSGIAAFLATPSSANLRTALTDEVGTGAAYFVGGALGTPASGTLTNATGLPLTTGVTGTLPIANGGTNDTGTAWTTYTASPACNSGSGTWTTNTAKFKSLGKTIFVQIDVTLTAVGTCTTGGFNFSAPTAVQSAGGMAGREIVATGTGIFCSTPIGGAFSCSLVTGSVASGYRFIASGIYEGT